MRWRLCLVFVAIYLTALSAVAAPQDAVVMVDARHGRDVGTDFGAGLVVGQTPARTVIVTALHVIADEKGDIAPEIRIEFSGRRGRFYSATASAYYTDRALDLAVLLIEHDRAGTAPDVIVGEARKLLSPTRPEELAGAEVSLIGAMNRERWARGPKGDRVVTGNAQQLRVHSVEAMAGASGGGLFDRFSRLVGMASRIDSTSGELVAVPIGAVLARLKRWGIEFSLEPALAASTNAALTEQLRAGLALEITFTEPEPSAPGGLWPGSPDGGFRQRLRARLSPTLREMAPVVRLEFLTYPRLGAIELAAPDYALEQNQFPVVFGVNALLVLPDQRRIGPVPLTLDFESGPVAAAKRLGYAPEVVARSRGWFDWQERELQAANERGATALRDAGAVHARNVELGMRENYTRTFHSWRIRCEKLDGNWICRQGGPVPRHPYGAQLSNVVHGLKLGASEQDLSISFPIDPSVDLAPLFPKEAAGLLDDGATKLFVWMRFSTGEALGPKQICAVSTKRRGAKTVCE